MKVTIYRSDNYSDFANAEEQTEHTVCLCKWTRDKWEIMSRSRALISFCALRALIK